MRKLRHFVAAALAVSAATVIAQQPGTSRSSAAFEIRGMKGLFWDGIEKYYQAVPWMAEHNINFLMLCYTAYPESARDWRKDYSDEQLAEMKELVTRSNDAGITVCLSFNPGIWSKPPLCHSCEDDYQASWRKIKDAHDIGIKWIALCLDDIHKDIVPADRDKYGTLQEAQVAFVNRTWEDMKALSPDMKLIFCPSAYTTKEMKMNLEYTRVIGSKISPEIDLFWTGPDVVSKTITVAEAQEAEQLLKRKPFVWDNYPVNDMFPWRPLLAPLDGRDPELAGAVSGILFNPMKQWEASKIPMVSVAEYLNNPAEYDPAEAKVKILAEYPEPQRPAIELLMKFYGSSFVGEDDYPPGPQIENAEDAGRVLADLRKLRTLLTDSAELQPLWNDVRETVEADIKRAEIIAEAPIFGGDRFTGGAPELARKAFGTTTGLVYARPTGKSRISATLSVDEGSTQPARIRLFARNGDKTKPRVCVTLNGQKVIDGVTEFSQREFEAREFQIPSDSTENGKFVLQIENQETTGSIGQPPWFAVKWVQLLP